MKRILLPVFLGVLALTCSCMKENETQTTPQAAITSFTLGNYYVKFHDFNYNRRDTVIKLLESGVSYPMTIDQLGCKIYNIDSLAYGSQLGAVTVSISSTGTVVYRYTDENNEDLFYYWSSKDTINFNRPLQFSVVSTDLSYRRDYKFQLNVHKVFPDSLIWTGADSLGFPVMDIKGSALKSDTIFAFGLDANGCAVLTKKNILSGRWSAIDTITGITASAWNSPVVSRGGRLYTVSDSCLYSSSNGADWVSVSTGFRTLFGNSGGTGPVWAASDDGKLLSSDDMQTWQTVQSLPDGFPEKSVMTSSGALETNANIIRTVAVGIGNDSVNASVWTKLSTDSVWTKTEVASYSTFLLPALDRLSLLQYDDALFAFGSGFEGFWQSNDHGTSWQFCDRFAEEYSSFNQYMQMPTALHGYDKGFAFISDSLGSIWIMTSDGQVWRGAINRLNKR